MNEPIDLQPVTAATLEAQYDAIFAELMATDATARRLQREADRYKELIRNHTHLRNVALAGLREHTTELKRRAVEELRKQTGIRVMPGFRAQKETPAQFRVRMNKQLRADIAQKPFVEQP